MHTESWWTEAETFRAALPIDGLAGSKVPFTTHCAIGSDFMERAHRLDLHCFPYVTFLVGGDGIKWNNASFNAYQGVDFSKHKFYEITDKGIPNPSPFGLSTGDGVGVTLDPCFVTCPNVLEYQNKMVEWVDYVMRLGADGVFIDNLRARQPCYGDRLGIHPHLFRNPTSASDASAQNQAFATLLRRVRDVVKKHKPDGRVLGNSGDPLNLPPEFQQYLDSDMLEGYVCDNHVRVPIWPTGGVTWDAAGRLLQTYLARNKQILVISNLDATSQAEDAFLSYASARLAGFIWTCGVSVPENSLNPKIRDLFNLRLGKQITGELTDPASGVNYRVFERGLVAVNPDTAVDKIITPRPPIAVSVFVDVFAGASTTVLSVPKDSGRVFLFGANDFGLGVLTP